MAALLMDLSWLSGLLNWNAAFTFSGAEAIIASFLIGVILAALIRHLFTIGLLIGLLVAVLVVVGAISLSVGKASGLDLAAIYTLATSVWTFLSTLVGAIASVVEKGGVDAGLAALGGFVIEWVGFGWIPLRRRDP